MAEIKRLLIYPYQEIRSQAIQSTSSNLSWSVPSISTSLQWVSKQNLKEGLNWELRNWWRTWELVRTVRSAATKYHSIVDDQSILATIDRFDALLRVKWSEAVHIPKKNDDRRRRGRLVKKKKRRRRGRGNRKLLIWTSTY